MIFERATMYSVYDPYSIYFRIAIHLQPAYGHLIHVPKQELHKDC